MQGNTKKYIFSSVIFLLLLAGPFIYIVVKDIQNDLPLREYVKETLLKRIQNDVHRFFNSGRADKLHLPELHLEIDKQQLADLDSMRTNKLEFDEENQQILNGQNQWKFVSATIKLNDTVHKIKIRIRGDMPSNFNRGLENSSYRFNVESNTAIFGKKKLSFERPFLQNNFYGYLFSHFFNKEGFIANDILFIRLFLNGKDNGIYFLQEGFGKELVESSDYRDGVIMRFRNDCEDNNGTYNSTWIPELNVYNEKKILKDSTLSKCYNRARFKFSSLRIGKIGPSQCFNTKKFAKYFALCDIFLAHHSYVCHNVKMYFNPINDKFEPIAWDPLNFVRYKTKLAVQPGYNYYSGEVYSNQKKYPIHYLLFKDAEFIKEFNFYLFEYSHNDTIRHFLEKHKDLIEAIDPELYREKFQPEFNSSLIIDNIQTIKNWFTTDTRLIAKAYRSEKILVVKSMSPLVVNLKSVKLDSGLTYKLDKLLMPFESDTFHIDSIDTGKWGKRLTLHSVIYGLDSTKMKHKIVVFERADNINSALVSEIPDTIILNFNKKDNTVSFRKQKVLVNKNLYIPPGFKFIIPAGTTVSLSDHANIICESEILAMGQPKNKIRISSDGTGGIVIKNAEHTSELKYVEFENLAAPKDGNWSVTGAVTFYDCSVNIKDCSFNNNKSEDAINIVRCTFNIDSCTFSNTLSDAIDIDFGRGSITNTTVSNTGNDGLDISGASVTVSNIHLDNIGDKGISGGEKASINASNIEINKSFIGIASKDKSFVNVQNSNIHSAKYPIAAYQKKPEYGPGVIVVKNTRSDSKNYLIEANSILVMDNDTFKTKAHDVYKVIYASK